LLFHHVSSLHVVSFPSPRQAPPSTSKTYHLDRLHLPHPKSTEIELSSHSQRFFFFSYFQIQFEVSPIILCRFTMTNHCKIQYALYKRRSYIYIIKDFSYSKSNSKCNQSSSFGPFFKALAPPPTGRGFHSN